MQRCKCELYNDNFEANKDKVAAYQKAYYEANKDKVAAYQKAYYEARKKRKGPAGEGTPDKLIHKRKW